MSHVAPVLALLAVLGSVPAAGQEWSWVASSGLPPGAPSTRVGGIRLDVLPGGAFLSSMFSDDFLSLDDGATWVRAPESLQGAAGLVRLPDGSVVACTQSALEGRRLLRSTDGGATWTSAALEGIPGDGAIARIFSLRDGSLWIGTTSGLFRSNDGGATWEPRMEGIEFDHDFGSVTVQAIEEETDGGLEAAVNGRGLHRLAPGAARWEKWHPTTQNHLLRILPGGAFLIGGGRGISRAGSRGAAWEVVLGGASSLEEIVADRILPVDGTWILAATCELEIDASTYQTTEGGGIWESRDAGLTWSRLAAPGLPAGRVHDLTLQPSGHLLAVVDGRGVFRSERPVRQDGGGRR